MAIPHYTVIFGCFLAAASHEANHGQYEGTNRRLKLINLDQHSQGDCSEITEAQLRAAIQKGSSSFGVGVNHQCNPKHNGLIIWEVDKQKIKMPDGEVCWEAFYCVGRSKKNSEFIEGQPTSFWQHWYEMGSVNNQDQVAEDRNQRQLTRSDGQIESDVEEDFVETTLRTLRDRCCSKRNCSISLPPDPRTKSRQDTLNISIDSTSQQASSNFRPITPIQTPEERAFNAPGNHWLKDFCTKFKLKPAEGFTGEGAFEEISKIVMDLEKQRLSQHYQNVDKVLEKEQLPEPTAEIATKLGGLLNFHIPYRSPSAIKDVLKILVEYSREVPDILHIKNHNSG